MLRVSRRAYATTARTVLTPLSDRVLVQRIKPAEKTIGGAVRLVTVCFTPFHKACGLSRVYFRRLRL